MAQLTSVRTRQSDDLLLGPSPPRSQDWIYNQNHHPPNNNLNKEKVVVVVQPPPPDKVSNVFSTNNHISRINRQYTPSSTTSLTLSSISSSSTAPSSRMPYCPFLSWIRQSCCVCCCCSNRRCKVASTSSKRSRRGGGDGIGGIEDSLDTYDSNSNNIIWIICAILTVFLVILVTILLTFHTLPPFISSSTLVSSDSKLFNTIFSFSSNANLSQSSSNLTSISNSSSQNVVEYIEDIGDNNHTNLSPLSSSDGDNYGNSDGDQEEEGEDEDSDDSGRIEDVNSRPYGSYSDYHSKYNSHSRSTTAPPKKTPLDFKAISRLSWEMLNRKSNTETATTSTSTTTTTTRKPLKKKKLPATTMKRTKFGYGQDSVGYDFDTLGKKEKKVVAEEDDDDSLPLVMVFLGGGGEEDDNMKNNGVVVKGNNNGMKSSSSSLSSSRKNCCKTQRYSQTINVDGCEPVTIINRMCIGQCVSVWIPNLFASFPVCKPSRYSTQIISLKCTNKQEKIQIKKVKVEKIRRCSCMDIA